jgi:transaldolase
MLFFLDTTDTVVLKTLAATGLVDGVTTNPSLIAKSGRPMLEVIAEICALVDGPISAEVAAPDAVGMVAEGRRLREIAANVVVKIPLTFEGLKATRTLADEGMDVNVTLCFSTVQALMAAKAGATFISPFIGRLDDYGATLPPAVFQDMIKHPLTEKGLEQFNADWAKTGQSIL